MPIAKSQATTITASTAETTIITADPLCSNQLLELVVTTPSVTVSTLTLRDSTGGTTDAIFDYPNASSIPGSPLTVVFNPPLTQTKNTAWTLQSSAANTYHILAVYAPL